MTRSQRLRPITELAAHHEREATRELGVTQIRLTEQRKLLGQLEGYREQYLTRSPLASTANAGPLHIQNYHAFVQRLDAAIAGQRQRVDEARTARDNERLKWMRRRSERRALDEASGRAEAAEQRDEARREQNDLDEIGARSRRTSG